MTASAFMPDVKVEIAFNAGYSTPTASRTWTDVSAYVELSQGIDIGYGRGDEFTTAEPNRLTLTLDNRDGRFTAGKTGGAYYPNVKIGRPIRVTSTINAITYTRFLGYVEEWPTEWPGTDSYAYAKISALSRMARLGLNAPLRSIVQEEFLSATPTAYWPLSEPAGSRSAADMKGGSPLVIAGVLPALAFGSAAELAGDAGTGVRTSDDGQYLSGTLATAISTAYPSTLVLEAFVTDPSTSGSAGIVRLTGTGSIRAIVSRDADNYRLRFDDGTTNTILLGGAAITGAHHIAAVFTRLVSTDMQLDLYVDGQVVATTTVASTTVTLTGITVGYLDLKPHTLSHAAINASLTTLADRVTAGLTGFNNESAGDRIKRLARYTGIAAAEVSVGTQTQSVAAIETSGATALDTMRNVETTEAGVLHDARDNTLTLKSRVSRYYTTSAFTLTAASQQIESDLLPKLDRTTLANDVTGTAADGTTARASDATSISEYGYARQQIDIAGTISDAFNAAAWAVLRFAEPLSRIPSLSVDLLPMSLSMQASIMTADIGTRLTLAGLPTQAPATTLDFFIEGYTETIDSESYRFTFNVTPVDEPTDRRFWILEDATYGVYDARPLAF